MASAVVIQGVSRSFDPTVTSKLEVARQEPLSVR